MKMLNKIIDIFKNYLTPFINTLGLITNSICIFIFIVIIIRLNGTRNKSKMYHYFLFKSLADLIINIITLIGLISQKFSSQSYYLNCVRMYLKYYLGACLFLVSNGFDIMATFDCAISIENKMVWCGRRPFFILITILILIFSFSFESFKLFIMKIKRYEVGESKNIYKIEFNSNVTDSYNKFLLAEALIRDFSSLVILLTINSYILFKLYEINKRKNNMASSNRGSISNHAKSQKMKMIIILFIVHFFCHILPFIYCLLSNGQFDYYLDVFSVFTLTLSLMISFLIYLFFNNVFKKTLFQVIKLG
jgi:hypothetical protein